MIIESRHRTLGMRGLGLGGAVCVNLSGAAVIMGWLMVGYLPIPPIGESFLWGVALFLLFISFLALFAREESEA